MAVIGLVVASIPIEPTETSFEHDAAVALAGRSAREAVGSVVLDRVDHGFEAVFDPRGARLFESNESADSPALASLRLTGVGRGVAGGAVGEGDVVRESGRLEIRRPGIVEWFENRPEGLEHGFSIASRTPGTQPLWLDLDVSPATARMSLHSVALTTPSGRRLDYAKLEVRDATGARIAAHFEVPDSSRIRLVVEDRAAAYPLLIDPILTGSFDSFLVSDQAASLFGYSVAGAGDVNGDGFDDVIVGAYDHAAPSLPFAGAAFIFLGSSSGVATANSSAAATRLFGTSVDQRFGVSVAGAGDVNGDGYDDVIVGSGYSNGQTSEGAAFIFHGGPGGIANGTSADANAVLEGNQVGAGFGYSVSSAGDVNGDGRDDVIVGAPEFDTDWLGDSFVDAGAAFVFLAGPSGVASAGAEVAATRLISLQAGSAFGFSVASAGDVDGSGADDVIVGARLFSSGQPDEGAAFIYHGSPTGIADGTTTTAATMLQSDDPDGQLFDVGPAGDLNGDGFDDVVVGVPMRASTDEGAAFIYMGSASGVASGGAAGATILLSDQYFALVGVRARTAGDVNDDGYSDLVVGASRYSSGQAVEGAVFVFLGRAGGIPAGTTETAFERLEVNEAGATLGTSVAGAGDVDGDGFSDIIAGAPYFGQGAVGSAYVWRGGDLDQDNDGLSDRAETRIHQTDPLVPDTDGDGFLDGFEVERGFDPLDFDDPRRVAPPFTSANVPLLSLETSANFRVDFTTLPGRPKLVVRAYPDAAHADMDLGIEISGCVLDDPNGSIACPPTLSVSVPRSPVANGESYPLWFCALAEQGLAATPPGHCDVRVRALDFGANGAPAQMSLAIRVETEVPTWTLPTTNVSTTQPSAGSLNSGTENFYSEGQNFRWIYDLDGDRVFHTPVAGRCEWVPIANQSPFQVSYSYEFQGSPSYAGLDCCTWQIGSTTGVTGTGQAIFYVNVDGNDPANQPGDIDRDGIRDLCDNCSSVPNGPLLGTCEPGSPVVGAPCRSNLECAGGSCSLAQDDTNRDRIGNVCAVPEPGVSGSLGAGLIVLGVVGWLRRSAR